MNMNLNFSNRPGSHRGFTIIEIMIALALGAIILLGVVEIFTNNNSTRAEIDRTARQIESGAYALGLIESDLTNAGFWGEAGEQPAGGTLPPVCPGVNADAAVGGAELVAALGYPLQGEDALGTSCVVPKGGSDFLAVRRTSSCSRDETGCDAPVGDFYMQVNACFEPSDSSAPLPGDRRITNVIADHDYTQRDCSTLAPLYRMISRVYFVDANDQLVRSELSGSGPGAYMETVLVEGVETMRLEYGLDTTGNGQVDTHTDSPAGTQWADVAMVRVSLVVRNLESSPSFSDTRTYTVAGAVYTVPVAFQEHKRQVYTRTVSIRNVAGRREQQ